ncbi:MAG: efflux RND transporter permease subunit, partial [Shimia sp.]|nr:efflux RND transporter permease subunit [Shimia sp.]
MFGLILAVGMLVDGAIVVVEYADKRIKEGVGPMHAYVEAAKRMFWPGVPGQFMGMLPVTLIFVLSASLVVALIYLPVMGGLTGRTTRWFGTQFDRIANSKWWLHLLMLPAFAVAAGVASTAASGLFDAAFGTFETMDSEAIIGSVVPTFAAFFVLALGGVAAAIATVAAGVALLLAVAAIITRLQLAISWAFRKVFPRREGKIKSGYRRTLFGHFINGIVANPVMPLVTIGAVIVVVGSVFIYFGQNNRGVEFFVESEPEQAIVYVKARGNLSLHQKDALLQQAEEVLLKHEGIDTAFAFAGEGGLNSNTGGAQAPKDMIGQIQLETIPWEDRPTEWATWFTLPVVGIDVPREVKDPQWSGFKVIRDIEAELKLIPGVEIEILELGRGPASAKPVHLRFTGENWDDLITATGMARAAFDSTAGLVNIEDTRPLPGIDWEIEVDVAKAGRYGANVATVGAMVQLVTRGILLDTMRVDSSDEEIDIRVRLPEQDRVLSTLDTLKVRTAEGLVPLSNFITRKPVAKLAEINRIGQQRYFDVKAGVVGEMMSLHNPETGARDIIEADQWNNNPDIRASYTDRGFEAVVLTPNERILLLTEWAETADLPASVKWQWTGDQEDEAESQAFLSSAFAGALFLMFIILLAQFNSLYNSVLVLLAVVLSTTGVLIGMLVMNQAFSIIMTGTGIVALAGIVVNNNIVLIDTYQEYSQYMPRIEAITRTAQSR